MSIDVKRLADRLSGLLLELDRSGLEARLAEMRREARDAREEAVLARLADHALALEPLLRERGMSRAELSTALELMLRLALEGGQGVG